MAETDVAPDPLLGRLVLQKFKIERLLGAGAMGRVYLAEQINLGKPVALKVLHASMTGDAALAKRFYREAKSASMLAHPNILQIIDFGDDDGLLFIAMELLTGRDLFRAIKMDWPLSLERVGHIGGQILSALDEAHAKGVVHRDLKPENVMLIDVRGESDFVKVCDFGIAKVASERDGEGSAITVAGMVCGTPEYMSPEQAKGDALDGRSDLYAAATILYQMVVGEVPFRAESALGVITKQLHEEPVPPSQRRANLNCPPALEALILRGLKKAKEERFASAGEMKAALYEALGMRRAGSSSPVVVRAGGGAVDAAALAATGVSTPVATPAQTSTPGAPMTARTSPSRAGRGLLLVGGAVACAVAVGVFVFVMQSKPTTIKDVPPLSGAPVPAKEPVVNDPTVKESPPTTVPAIMPIPNANVVAPPTVIAMGPSHKRDHHPSASAAKGTRPADYDGIALNSGSAGAGAPLPAAATAAVAAAPAAAKPLSAAGTFAAVFADGEQRFRAGDIEGALGRYQDAARRNATDAKTQRQIGKCYNRLGQRDRALPHFKRYLELAPDASDAAFIRAILDGK